VKMSRKKNISDPILQAEEKMLDEFERWLYSPETKKPYTQRRTVQNSANVNCGELAGDLRRRTIDFENRIAEAERIEKQKEHEHKNEEKKRGEK